MKHRVMRAELPAWVGTTLLDCVGTWNSADPLYVQLTFTEGGKSVQWDVPREGLVTGMELVDGGDLGIRRDLASDLVVITLLGRDADHGEMRAEISLAALTLDNWVDETDLVVPIGGELRDVNWDLLTFRTPPPVPEADLLGDCRVCLPDSEPRRYLELTRAPGCPVCGRKLR